MQTNLMLATVTLLLLVVGLTACERPCPRGAKLVGTPPPNGTEQWCQYQNETGSLLKNGVYRSWYENGQPRLEVLFVENVPKGEIISWHPNGQRALQAALSDTGKLHGPVHVFYSNGQTRFEGSYTNGVPMGDVGFYAESGVKALEATVHGPKNVGLLRIWTDEGQRLVIEGYDKEGLKQGEGSYWYKNEQLAAKLPWVDGRLQGRIERWYPNGKPYLRREIDDGNVQGTEAWYENGNLRFSHTLDRETGDNTTKVYREDGILLMEVAGTATRFYHENGQVWLEQDTTTSVVKKWRSNGKSYRIGRRDFAGNYFELEKLQQFKKQTTPAMDFFDSKLHLENEIDVDVEARGLYPSINVQLRIVGAEIDYSKLPIVLEE